MLMRKAFLIICAISISLLTFQNCGKPSDVAALLSEGGDYGANGEEPWHGNFTGIYEDLTSSCPDGTRGHRIELDSFEQKYFYKKKDCIAVNEEVQIVQWVVPDQEFVYDGRTFVMTGR
jgi:hypothetical protein